MKTKFRIKKCRVHCTFVTKIYHILQQRDDMSKIDAALDILRRLDPSKVTENLDKLISLDPEMAEELLSTTDVPLRIATDPTENNREYLCCDYNRDLDSFRSPWSNKYFPKLTEDLEEDCYFPEGDLRSLELLMNDSFDVYRDLYYEGGISSVYLWELGEDEDTELSQETDFAGVLLLKKSNVGHWDSIHVFEIRKDGNQPCQYIYKVTTTIILDLQDTNKLRLAGNLIRQSEKTCSVNDETDNVANIHTQHVTNLGTIVEEIETQMRSMLDTVYFEKTRDIFQQVRNSNTGGMDIEKHKELIEGLQQL